MERSQGVKGVQSIVRAANILRMVGKSRSKGCSVTEISQGTGLHIATAKRILSALTQENLLIWNAKTKKYFVSYDLYLMCSKSYFPVLKDQLHDSLVLVAEKSEDTTFLIVPMGNNAICIDRVEGNYPIRTLTFNIGDHRPLGIGAGALAILSSYKPNQIEKFIRANKAKYWKHHKRTPDEIHGFVDQTHETGYALSVGNITPGAVSVALPILNSRGEPLAAMAIAAVKERMKPHRRKFLVGLLTNEIGVVQSLFH